MIERTGTLFVVGTPIGNLEDVTLRALRVLREADIIAAEDTRHTGHLLGRYEIRKLLVSYHEHNEARRTPELMNRLQEGQSVALVSDAGMPTISDPGWRLIRAAIQDGIRVESVPGPSAVTAAVSLAGLTDGPFYFHGFLPHKTAQRRKILTGLDRLKCALVFFESPYRVVKSLRDMRETLGNRRVVVARELTKKFEEFIRGTLDEVMKRLENKTVRGEITIVLEGHSND
jgi:16S rRNA (cytidine1402-2'-O)-methyltransferase